MPVADILVSAAAAPPSRDPLRLSVVIPVLDEAESIAALVAEVRAQLPDDGSAEIIVVDDGSRDQTCTVLAALRRGGGATLRVLRHRANYGQSSALHTGFRAARAAWVATLDGDGQNDPADLPRLLALVAAEPAGSRLRMVCGHRVTRRDGAVKRISSRIANAVRSRLLRDRTPDTGCGLKLVHRETFLALPFFDHMHRFLPALVQRAGGEVRSVPVNHRPRRAGRSKYGLTNRLFVGIIDLIGVAWLQLRVRRPEHDELED